MIHFFNSATGIVISLKIMLMTQYDSTIVTNPYLIISTYVTFFHSYDHMLMIYKHGVVDIDKMRNMLKFGLQLEKS